MLGFSLRGWENFMVGSLVVAGTFALVAGVATWAVVRLQRVELAEKDREFEKYKLETEAHISEADEKGKLATEHAAELAVELEHAKTEAKQIDANLLREQRLTALERWRLRRVERAVLPRSLFIDWNSLSFEIKKQSLDKIYLIILDDEDMELGDLWINLAQCLQNANVKVSISKISSADFKYLPNTATGIGVVAFDDKGTALANVLWQKFRLGGGTMGGSLRSAQTYLGMRIG